jgi:hypothetical protein
LCAHLHFSNVSACFYKLSTNFQLYSSTFLCLYFGYPYPIGCHNEKERKMNKLLVTLGLAATVALVGCNKDKAPETGATTGEHLENAAEQAGADIKDATATATDNVATAVDNAGDQVDAAADHTANATAEAAAKTEAAARDATAKVAGAVESGAADVKEKAQQ